MRGVRRDSGREARARHLRVPEALRPGRGGWRSRGVEELAEQAGDHEGHLLADVDGVVADAFERSGGQHHRHRPFTSVGVGAAHHGELKDLAMEAVDPETRPNAKMNCSGANRFARSGVAGSVVALT